MFNVCVCALSGLSWCLCAGGRSERSCALTSTTESPPACVAPTCVLKVIVCVCVCVCVCVAVRCKSLNKVQANELEGLWNSSWNTYVHLFSFCLCEEEKSGVPYIKRTPLPCTRHTRPSTDTGNDITMNRNPVKGLWKKHLRFVIIWLHQFYLMYTMHA